ncbi:MAG: hypothetical protein HQL80_05725 [Magnetococcales bacterium]|nr:hypothetical protein [Magnetococcales bacterium]
MDTENLLSAGRKQAGGKFQPGVSGNPKGRPRGNSVRTSLRAMLEDQGTALVEQAVTLALEGDSVALRLCLERILPAVRPVEQSAPFTLPDGTLTEQGKAVLVAMADGLLSPGQGAQLLSAISTLARVVEVDDLTRRIGILEEKNAKS